MYFLIFNFINYNFILRATVLITLAPLFFILRSGLSGAIRIFYTWFNIFDRTKSPRFFLNKSFLFFLASLIFFKALIAFSGLPSSLANKYIASNIF